MPPGPEGLVVIAAMAASAACAPMERDLDVGTLERLMTAMRIDGVVVAEGSASNAARAARSPGIPLIEVSAPADGPAGGHELRTDSRRPAAPPERPGPDGLAFVWHTSGTTGVPKVVAYEQWRICFDVRRRIDRRRPSSSDRCLVTSTLSSAATARVAVLSNLAVGAASIHPIDLKAEAILAAVESLAPTFFMAAPALHSRLLELIDKRGFAPRHSLRAIYSSFADQSPQVRSRLAQALGVPMLIAYGMTEMGGIAETPMPPDAVPVGSVGLPVLDLAIADDAGSCLGRGEKGEVWVRGPEVIEAYESPPEANREAFRDGWFRTGDCGFLDERGVLHLTGRNKDAINRGGAKVSPVEVEFALESHPAVREAAAVARRHTTLGEDLCAAAVFEPGRRASEAELRRFVRHRLSAARVPTRIVAATGPRRNAAGKLQRTELAAFGEALLKQSRQPLAGPDEEQVARIFCEVLRVDDIGRNDQFFDRGGDSLRAVELLERVKERFGVSLSMDVLLDNPAAEALAEIVAQARERTVAQPT